MLRTPAPLIGALGLANMSISGFFEKLGAPLHNKRWSWGSVRKADGAVFLRVWQDEKVVIDKLPVMMVTHHDKYASNPDDLGYQERLSHIELIRNGVRCYMVMCRAKDPNKSPREIASWNKEVLFEGGEIVEMNGDTWIKVRTKVKVAEVTKQTP